LLIVRKFIETDRAVLKEIYLHSRKQTFHWLNTSAYQLNDFDIDTEGEQILVAVDDSVIKGFVSLWMADNFIHHLHVHSSYLNNGIGKKLLMAAIHVADKPLTLKCQINNRKALEFYKIHGWKCVSEGKSIEGDYYLLMYP
jgi:GNAT superfamily N-acetyltransferase